MQQLRPETTLQGGRYRILRTLGQGGFGITYLALQSGLERKVAVKEFFMKDLCGRDADSSRVTLGTEGSRETVGRFREKFLKEARNIASLSHPNIVRIHDVFEENGTAYYVMEYAEGGSLADKVKREGALKEAEATRYILRVAEALGYVHQRKMNHLDVKPSNIMLNAEGEPVLIDFGLAKQYDAATGGQTSSTPVGISEGYAPLEQYMEGGVATFSPETDIYALGATYYKLLTSMTPPKASDVNEDGLSVEELRKWHVSDKAVAVISHAMEGRRKDRPKDVEAFIAALATPSQKEKPNTAKEDLTQHPEQANLAAEETQLQDSDPKPEPQNVAAQTFTVKGVSFKMVHVKAGSFTMGATSEQQEYPYSYEKPAHRVTLTDDYWMGATVVTQALWKAVMGSNPSLYKGYKGSNRPVESVSWWDCQAFITKLNRITGKRFRLPTEAEWEYAARGGSKSRGYQYAGSSNLDEVAWYDVNAGGKTHPVGQLRANELGLYDMSGNVWEWCQDWYGKDYYSSGSQTNPTGPSSGSYRVLRGGSWNYYVRGCRSSCRGNYAPGIRNSDAGFRLVLSE